MAIVQPNNAGQNASYSHSYNSRRYFPGCRVSGSSPEINLLSTPHVQIPKSLSPISYNGPTLNEQLFLLHQENNLLRKENHLLKSYLSTKEQNENWNTLLVEARASNLLVHHTNEVMLKLQFLEQVFDILVEMGVLDGQSMDLLEREMEQRASITKGEDDEDDTEMPKARDSQVILDIPPYVPRFLKPVMMASSLHDPPERACVGMPAVSKPPTREQLEALSSIQRLVSPLSTDLGSLEISSQDSRSLYGNNDSALDVPDSSVAQEEHRAPADTTLVVGQATPSKFLRHTRSTSPKSQLPVRIQDSSPSLRGVSSDLFPSRKLPQPTVLSKSAHPYPRCPSSSPSSLPVGSSSRIPRLTPPRPFIPSFPKSPCGRGRIPKLGVKVVSFENSNNADERLNGRRGRTRK